MYNELKNILNINIIYIGNHYSSPIFGKIIRLEKFIVFPWVE